MSSRPAAATICAFVALEMPREVQTAIAGQMVRLEKAIPGVHWIDPHRTHLTLRFLGWTTRERLNVLQPYLARAAKACPALDVKVRGLGTFPPTGPGDPRVLWAGVDLPQPGRALQAACDAAAVECGFPPERRAFQPHVTLGRWKQPVSRPALPEFDLGATRLERLVLFRTEPTKDEGAMPGARRTVAAYSKLAVFPLG